LEVAEHQRSAQNLRLDLARLAVGGRRHSVVVQRAQPARLEHNQRRARSVRHLHRPTRLEEVRFSDKNPQQHLHSGQRVSLFRNFMLGDL
jgi:hypothetical protein